MPSWTNAPVVKDPEVFAQMALTSCQGWADIFLRYFLPRLDYTTSMGALWPKIWPRDSC